MKAGERDGDKGKNNYKALQWFNMKISFRIIIRRAIPMGVHNSLYSKGG